MLVLIKCEINASGLLFKVGVNHAKLCCKLKRWEDTVDCLKKVIKMGLPLNYEERQLLFNAFSLKIDSLIETWGSLEKYSENNKIVKSLIEKVEQEIIVHRDNFVKFLDNDLIKKYKNIDAIVDYKCGKASQFSRVLFMSEENSNDEVRKTKELFEEAMTIARNSLKASHPVRIWTALQFSRFHKNICNCVE